MSRVVDSWKNSRFNLLSPCFWTAGRGKNKTRMQQRSAWLLHEVVITIPPEKLSWYWFLGKMGHISMNQLCYFIPTPFISCSSSSLLGPKAGLALPTALIKEKVIFLAGNESLQYTVLSVCGWGGETKCKEVRLRFGRFAGLSCCRHQLFLGCWAAFFLCGWRQVWPPFTDSRNRERQDEIFCRKWGEFTCLGLARGPSKTSSRYWSRSNSSLPLWRRTLQRSTGTLIFPCLARCRGMFNTVVFKMLLFLIGCYLSLDTDLSIPLAFLWLPFWNIWWQFILGKGWIAFLESVTLEKLWLRSTKLG